jgi:hypothetical protein
MKWKLTKKKADLKVSGNGQNPKANFPVTVLRFHYAKCYYGRMKDRISPACLFLLFLVFTILSAMPVSAQGTMTAPPKKPPVINPNDTSTIPQEYFEEAEAFLKNCEAQPNMTQFYNCDCLSYEFLEMRIKNPQMNQSAILGEIDRTCIDASEAAGYEYERCLGNAPLLPNNIPFEEYCTCFANTYAQSFEFYMPKVTSKSIVELQTQAHLICANPAVGRKMFPYDAPPPKRR